MKQQTFRIYTLSLLILGLTACQSTPPIEVPTGTPVLVETKAQIKNDKESHTVNIDIAMEPQKIVRLEVTGTLGIKVASVLMTPQKIQYALHTKQVYAEGPFTARTMTPIFGQPLDPRVLWRIIHNQTPQVQDLKCEVDPEGRPITCVGPQSLNIRWTYTDNKKRKIELKAAPFEMIWLFKNEKLLSDSQSETFVLKKPNGYKEILIK